MTVRQNVARLLGCHYRREPCRYYVNGCSTRSVHRPGHLRYGPRGLARVARCVGHVLRPIEYLPNIRPPRRTSLHGIVNPVLSRKRAIVLCSARHRHRDHASAGVTTRPDFSNANTLASMDTVPPIFRWVCACYARRLMPAHVALTRQDDSR
jgi:hypothetical protein